MGGNCFALGQGAGRYSYSTLATTRDPSRMSCPRGVAFCRFSRYDLGGVREFARAGYPG